MDTRPSTTSTPSQGTRPSRTPGDESAGPYDVSELVQILKKHPDQRRVSEDKILAKVLKSHADSIDLSGLDNEKLEGLTQSMKLLNYNEDDVIFDDDDPLSGFYIVLSGDVQVHNSMGVTRVLEAGSVLGNTIERQKATEAGDMTRDVRAIGVTSVIIVTVNDPSADRKLDDLSRNPAIAFLSNHWMFKNWGPDALVRLLPLVKAFRKPKGEEFIGQGEVNKFLYFIKSGEVAMRRRVLFGENRVGQARRKHHDFTLAIVSTGDLLNEASFLSVSTKMANGNVPSFCSLHTITPLEGYRINAGALCKIMGGPSIRALYGYSKAKYQWHVDRLGQVVETIGVLKEDNAEDIPLEEPQKETAEDEESSGRNSRSDRWKIRRQFDPDATKDVMSLSVEEKKEVYELAARMRKFVMGPEKKERMPELPELNRGPIVQEDKQARRAAEYFIRKYLGGGQDIQQARRQKKPLFFDCSMRIEWQAAAEAREREEQLRKKIEHVKELNRMKMQMIEKKRKEKTRTKSKTDTTISRMSSFRSLAGHQEEDQAERKRRMIEKTKAALAFSKTRRTSLEKESGDSIAEQVRKWSFVTGEGDDAIEEEPDDLGEGPGMGLTLADTMFRNTALGVLDEEDEGEYGLPMRSTNVTSSKMEGRHTPGGSSTSRTSHTSLTVDVSMQTLRKNPYVYELHSRNSTGVVGGGGKTVQAEDVLTEADKEDLKRLENLPPAPKPKKPKKLIASSLRKKPARQFSRMTEATHTEVRRLSTQEDLHQDRLDIPGGQGFQYMLGERTW